MLRSDNGPCYSSREFHNFLNFYQVDHITSSPHYPQSNGFAEALVGIAKKLMDKSLKRGKTVEFWSSTVLDHSNLIYTPVSIRDVDRKKATFEHFPEVPSSIGHNMDTSRIRKEITEKTTYHFYFPQGPTELEPWTTSFCQGSTWKCLENSYHRSTSC